MTQPEPWPEPRWPERGRTWPGTQDAWPAEQRPTHGDLARSRTEPSRVEGRASARAGARKRRGRRARRRPTTTGTATLTACFAAALVAAALTGQPALGLGVLAVQVGLVLGWLRVADVPGQVGALVIGIGAAVSVDALVLLGPADRSLGPAAPVLAGAALAALFHQLVRGGERADTTGSLAACLFGAVLVMLAAAWLPASTARADGYVAAAMLAALVAAGLLEAAGSALRLPRSFRIPAAVAAAAAAGTGVGTWSASFTPVTGAALGVTAGLLGAAAFAVAALSRRYASDRTLFAATIPVAAVGPAAYFLGRLLGG